MLEHRDREALDVVGHDVVAPDARGERAGGALQRERAPRADPERRGRGGAGSRSTRSTMYALQLGRRRAASATARARATTSAGVVTGASSSTLRVAAVGVEDRALGVIASGSPSGCA